MPCPMPDKELLTMLINGFTQSEIGAEMGVSQQSVSKTNKKSPKDFSENGCKIALSLASLLRGDERFSSKEQET